MYIGLVIGNVVCTIKDPTLTGIKLLVIQPLNDEKKPIGDPIVAADGIATSGIGEFVYLAGQKEAAYPFPNHFAPVDAAIVGFIDQYYIDTSVLPPKMKRSAKKISSSLTDTKSKETISKSTKLSTKRARPKLNTENLKPIKKNSTTKKSIKIRKIQ